MSEIHNSFEELGMKCFVYGRSLWRLSCAFLLAIANVVSGRQLVYTCRFHAWIPVDIFARFNLKLKARLPKKNLYETCM